MEKGKKEIIAKAILSHKLKISLFAIYLILYFLVFILSFPVSSLKGFFSSFSRTNKITESKKRGKNKSYQKNK